MSDKINHTELILERMKHEAEMAKLQNENDKLKSLLKEAIFVNYKDSKEAVNLIGGNKNE